MSLAYLSLLQNFHFPSLNKWINKDPVVLYSFVNSIRTSIISFNVRQTRWRIGQVFYPFSTLVCGKNFNRGASPTNWRYFEGRRWHKEIHWEYPQGKYSGSQSARTSRNTPNESRSGHHKKHRIYGEQQINGYRQGASKGGPICWILVCRNQRYCDWHFWPFDGRFRTS